MYNTELTLLNYLTLDGREDMLRSSGEVINILQSQLQGRYLSERWLTYKLQLPGFIVLLTKGLETLLNQLCAVSSVNPFL